MLHRLSLNGAWDLRWFDGQRHAHFVASARIEEPSYPAMEAQVPGEVHLDLMRHGVIEDPCLGDNVLKCRWVEEFIWAYRRTFDAGEAAKGRAWLVFDRLFLNARIVLNGEEAGAHGNSFRPCRIEVTGKLKETGNVLAVFVESGLYGAADKAAKGYAFHEDAKLHKRHFQRAPQCSFGWDWSPRLLNVGISGDVSLEWTDAPFRWDCFVPLATLSDDLSEGRLKGRFNLDGFGEAEGVAALSIPELGLEVEAPVSIKEGETVVELDLEVPGPELWQPRGFGEARTYEAVAVLRGPWGEVEKRQRVGFRHVEWDQSAHPEGGSCFRLKVNGNLVFCKGANLVPSDTLFARIDRASYRGLVDRAIEANFNFLRVWGGGLYEPDEFYDICDEEGILVWQEFIYACSRYPTLEPEFNEEAKKEAVHHIRRLAGRPSLVAWCGNNENETGNWHWGFDKDLVHPDYAFFHLTLRQLMAKEDPTRYYQPSSPLSPAGIDPDDELRGDQHPWSIGFTDTDTRGYRKMRCRFPNEGGTLGPTTLGAAREALAGGPFQAGSFAWDVHDNSIATWHDPSPIEAQVEAFCGKKLSDMSVEEFVYWGGLVQGEGLREYIEAFRRRMFDTGSAIFWMFNDIWPAVRSWTIVDHKLRRCPAFGPVQRAMEPLSVVISEGTGEILVHGINDTLAPVSPSLEAGWFGLGGGIEAVLNSQIELPPNASTVIARLPLTGGEDLAAQAPFAFLDLGGGRVKRSRLFLPKWTDLSWHEPEVKVWAGNGGLWAESPVFVPGVACDLEGEADASCNYLDLYPGRPVWFPATKIMFGSLPGTSVKVSELSV